VSLKWWGRHWDPLLAKDASGALKAVMEETVDGEYQRYQVKGGAYTRENSLVNTQKLLN
jgi:pyruvate dehydrogenase E1 component